MELHDCGAIRELLPDYAAGQLGPGARRAVEAHLAVCDRGCPAEAREWLALADTLTLAGPAVPADASAARGLAGIRARLGRTEDGRNIVRPLERNANHAMPYQDDSATWTDPAPDGAVVAERGHPRGDTPGGAPPPRRVSAWMAAGAVAVLLALTASLFYLFAPQLHPARTVARPTITVAHPSATHTPAATGPNWRTAPLQAQAPADVEFAQSAPQTGYLCSNNAPNPAPSTQWLFKTTDGGTTWTPLSGLTTPAEPPPVHIGCNVFINASDASDVFVQVEIDYAGSYGPNGPPVSESLWRSRDGGATWGQLTVPQPILGWRDIVVTGSRIIAMASYSSQTGPFCGAASSSSQMDDLYASDDGGATWNQIGQSLTAQGLSLTALKSGSGPVLQNVGASASVVVSTYCQVNDGTGSGGQQAYWRSDDGGNTWSQVNIPGQFAGDLRFTAGPGGAVYGVAAELASTHGGVAVSALVSSSDGGQTWSLLPDARSAFRGQPTSWATSLAWAIVAPDGNVLASMSVFNPNTGPTSGPASAGAGVYWVNMRGADRAWILYAPAGSNTAALFEPISDSPLASVSGGYTLWASDQDQQAPQILYLAPLP